MPLMRTLDRLVKVLRSRPTVTTRAVIWSIPHNSGKEDISLKIGRYKKSLEMPPDEIPESLQPKSELTLDDEEFKTLIEFLQEQYEPFRQGVKAFIPLDKPYEKENADQIRALFVLPDKQKLVQFILLMRPAKCARIPLRINGILPENQVIMTDALCTI